MTATFARAAAARVLFWDIDGTLLTTGKAGVPAWEAAVREVIGRDFELSSIRVAGLTDYQIAVRTFEMLGVNPDEDQVRSMVRRYEELLPETTLGNFFNRQDRQTTTFQWIEAVSSSRKGPGGLHLVKAGFDAMHSDYTGTSVSGPVLIERSNGTLSRTLEYGGPTEQAVHATDSIALPFVCLR